MQVALNSADDGGAELGGLAGGEQRLDDFHAHVHDLRGQQDVGNEHFVSGELFADLVDAGEKAAVEDFLGADALVESLLDLGFDGADLTGNYHLGNFIESGHSVISSVKKIFFYNSSSGRGSIPQAFRAKFTVSTASAAYSALCSRANRPLTGAPPTMMCH